MNTSQAHVNINSADSSLLSSGVIWSDLQSEVEAAVASIENLVFKTQWLSEKDKEAVFNWIESQEKAASDYYEFIHERTKLIKKLIKIGKGAQPAT